MKKLLTSPWALLAAILLLRLPGFVFGALNIDETDYLVYGAGIWKGLLPYRDLVEIKPPLGYFTYALGGGLAWPVRALGVLWVLATALVLRAAARRWTGSDEAGWAAAWLSLLAGLVEVPWLSSESMMNLPVAAALYFFVRGRRAGDLLLTGFFIGVATLYRHQSGIAAIALGLALLYEDRRQPGRALSQLSALAAGAIAPWALAAGAYAAIGQLPAFLDWAIVRNLSYANSARAGSAVARAVVSTALCAGVACLPWALAARESVRPRADVVWGALVLLLWLSWIPVSLGGRFYEHYYLVFVAPLALLAAPAAARWREWLPRARRLAFAGAAVPLAAWLAVAWGKGLAGGYPEQDSRTRELACWLRANTAPADTLFVWGHYSPIYTLSQRLPGTRYVNATPLIGNYDPGYLDSGFDPARARSQRDVEAALNDLDRREPAWFVDTAPADIHAWGRVPLSAFPELERYRAEHYAEAARPGGVAVYRRRQPPPKEARRGVE